MTTVLESSKTEFLKNFDQFLNLHIPSSLFKTTRRISRSKN